MIDIVRPVDECGHVNPVDGLCAHPSATTPECHCEACPLVLPGETCGRPCGACVADGVGGGAMTISVDVKSSGKSDGVVNGAWARSSSSARQWLTLLVREVAESRPPFPAEGVAITIRRES